MKRVPYALTVGSLMYAKLSVVGYTDSNFQIDKDDRKSTFGMVFVIGRGAVIWRSAKQKSTADSTTEAEYLAASEVAKEGVWLKKFLTNLGVVPDLPMDNNRVKDRIEDENEQQEQSQERDKGLKGKFSTRKLVPFDSFDMENGTETAGYSNHRSSKVVDWGTLLKLAFQSVGIVYGDIGTSPLYVFPGIFPNGIAQSDDILGVLSLIIYSLALITLIKYVFIVLSANDNGEGGTFALYSLICRYAKVSLTPNQQAEDKDVSNYQLELPNRRLRRASAVKYFLESSRTAKYFLLFMTMLGTSMVLGDGILTPSISVLSAVAGIREVDSSLTDDTIMWISVVILILLFQFQRFGTDKVGFTFAPILTIWFLFIAVIGVYNFIVYDPSVIKALNPMYIVKYFQTNKENAWISLGGVVLCLTGSEALFADLGHFNVRSIQISTCTIVFPSIVIAYVGQAAYLTVNPLNAYDAFYKSVPKPVYWPMLVVAVLAAIIASQSLISASFSIVQQSLALGCFPRVKVVHTSSKYEGQVYVPEINNLLMIACVAVTLGFKTTVQIGNAFGIAVVFVMTLTSGFLILVMIMIWKTNLALIILYVLTITLVELIYLSSVLFKFVQGGYLPLAFAALLMSVMFVWNYVYRKKYMFDLENKVSVERLKEIANNPQIQRVPGVALFYSELVQGISPIFTHYSANVPALHTVLVFVSIKSLPISKVPDEERFLFRQVDPHGLRIFRCIVRYGYKDVEKEGESFESTLVNRLKDFIKEEVSRIDADEAAIEVQLVDNECKKSGITYIVGESEVVASPTSSLGKKLIIDYAYNGLRRCLRQQDQVFAIPRKRLLKVGMTYEL
ncbi:potassium transporter 19-like [Telopea speciosissima]|uniref:potassium transporter 19-like n=1 Tax=Telopea speciosissima TaxID=54955 RepID=UPI001CC4CBB0|nr:potassium transporter 19-like [Telopea speciosissima]